MVLSKNRNRIQTLTWGQADQNKRGNVVRGKSERTREERKRKTPTTEPGVIYRLCRSSPMAAAFFARGAGRAVRNPPTVVQQPRVLFHRAAARSGGVPYLGPSPAWGGPPGGSGRATPAVSHARRSR